jgi:hypothetical protein
MKNILIILLIISIFSVLPVKVIGQSAVSTFESIGLYWSPSGGSSSNECRVQYRVSGQSSWREGLPLWFDPRDQEYRGSIVHLNPGTSYEIRLTLDSGTSTTLNARTWSDNFPIARTVHVSSRNQPLIISEGGSSSGYILYTHPPDQESIIDVQNNHAACVSINAPYVIVRGLTLRGGREDGIQINNGAHDIVIENNDISGWGRVNSRGAPWGRDSDAGIAFGSSSGNQNSRRIIIQRNRIHHPRYNTFSWYEFGTRNNAQGPFGMAFYNGGGQFVIRYNEIYSDEDHQFHDGIGGGPNWSDTGFPNRDSDIYGNRVSMCWGDGIESEGGNSNVRIWGNYIDKFFMGIGNIVVDRGPCYLWRNVMGRSLISSQHGDFINDDWYRYNRGGFTHAGYSSTWGGGRVYVFHNTVLQPEPSGGMEYPLGVCIGLRSPSGLMRYYSRNNIIQVCASNCYSVSDKSDSDTSDLDYDLVNGRVDVDSGEETHAIRGIPIYASGNGPEEFFLSSSSPGYDDGIRLYNFNDNFAGSAPDMGAFESGSSPLEFGVSAYLSPGSTTTTTISGTTTTTSPTTCSYCGDATPCSGGETCDNQGNCILLSEGQGDCDCDENCQSGLYCDQVSGADYCCPVGTSWDGSGCSGGTTTTTSGGTTTTISSSECSFCGDTSPCSGGRVCDYTPGVCIDRLGEGQGDCDCDENCQSGLYCDPVTGGDDYCCAVGTSWDGGGCSGTGVTTTTIPPTTTTGTDNPPYFSNLRHNPLTVLVSDAVDILVDWFDDVGLQQIIIQENSTGEWLSHTVYN